MVDAVRFPNSSSRLSFLCHFRSSIFRWTALQRQLNRRPHVSNNALNIWRLVLILMKGTLGSSLSEAEKLISQNCEMLPQAQN